MTETMDIFSSKPISFKLDRRSSQASKLKQAVLRKLAEYLGNYYDDVLAEYIVVLVCNGKHQNQAKEDLEAFLGVQSGKFVIWLWEHLSKNAPLSSTSGSSSLKGVTFKNVNDSKDKGARVIKSMIQQNHASIPSETPALRNDKYCRPSTPSLERISLGTEHADKFQRWCPEPDAPVSPLDNEKLSLKIENNFIDGGTTTTTSCSYNPVCVPSIVKSPTRATFSNNECFPRQDRCEEILPANGIVHSHQHPMCPNEEPSSTKMQSSVADKQPHHLLTESGNFGEAIYSSVPEILSHQNSRPRGNVWDRLGKPREDFLMDGNADGVCYAKRKKLRYEGNPSGINAVLASRLKSSMRNGSLVCGAGNDVWTAQIKEKQFSGISNYGGSTDELGSIQCKDIGQNLQKPFCTRDDFLEKVHPVSLHHQNSNDPVECIQKFPAKAFNAQVGQTQYHKQSVTVASNSDVFPHSQPVVLKPVEAEVLGVKQRLEKIENEMNKMRPKQSGSSCATSNTCLLGARNQAVEDMDSRTVFVTNVHFAATKEALSSHFSRCGNVVKSILLTESCTGQPTGSAYVVFSCKEAADKAVLLTGTSFLSRILKIIHKADMQAEALESLRPAKSRQLQYLPLPQKKIQFSQKPHFGSPLQWHRNQSSDAGKLKPA